MPFGITVTTQEAPATGGGISPATGTAFIVGVADQGPFDRAVLVQSLASYISAFGPRSAASAALYDAVQTFFAEQGAQAYIAREVGSAMSGGPAAYTAHLSLPDANAHAAVLAQYLTPGADGNDYEVGVTVTAEATFTATSTTSSDTLTYVSDFDNIEVGTLINGGTLNAAVYVTAVNEADSSLTLSAVPDSAGRVGAVFTPNTFTVTVDDAEANELESWGPFASAAQLYAVDSGYVAFSADVSSSGEAPAALAPTALAGGADDLGDISDTSVADALELFAYSYGPGQVSAPLQTDATVHAALTTHAQANRRFAILDVADNSTVASVLAGLGAITDSSRAFPVAGSGIIPGIVSGTTRTVAASAVVSALCAQADATGNPNQAPAGVDWPLQYVIGFTESFSLADIATLNAAGVNSFREINGVLCLYGFSTFQAESSDPVFWQASHSRLRMALQYLFEQTAEPYMFAQIDGKGILLAGFGGALAADLLPLYSAGALYGDTAAEAYSVDVGPSVNPVGQLAQGIISADVDVAMSPFAEAVKITLTTSPITQSI